VVTRWLPALVDDHNSHSHEVPISTVAANVLAFPAVAPALLLGLAAATIVIVVPDEVLIVSIL
jgi:hypothetical protein